MQIVVEWVDVGSPFVRDSPDRLRIIVEIFMGLAYKLKEVLVDFVLAASYCRGQWAFRQLKGKASVFLSSEY